MTACLSKACHFLPCDSCCALQVLEAQAEVPANIVTQSKAPESLPVMDTYIGMPSGRGRPQAWRGRSTNLHCYALQVHAKVPAKIVTQNKTPESLVVMDD